MLEIHFLISLVFVEVVFYSKSRWFAWACVLGSQWKTSTKWPQISTELLILTHIKAKLHLFIRGTHHGESELRSALLLRQCLFCVYFALQVFSNQFFLVQMDDMREEAERKGGSRLFVCHRDSPGIFPAQWSFKNGVKLSPPPGTADRIFTSDIISSFMLAWGVLVVQARCIFYNFCMLKDGINI